MYQIVVSVGPVGVTSGAKIRPHHWVSAQSDDINHIKVTIRRSAERDMNMNPAELDEIDDVISNCYGILIKNEKFKGMTQLFGDGSELIVIAIYNEEDLKAREDEINALLGMDQIAANPNLLN